MHTRPLTVVSTVLGALTAVAITGCTSQGLATSVPVSPTASPVSAAAPTTTQPTQAPIGASAAPILGIGGTFVGLSSGDGDAAVAWLSALFGSPDGDTPLMCDTAAIVPGRSVSWGDLTILIASKPSATKKAPLVGWTYGFLAKPTRVPALTTSTGIGAGATKAEVMKAYPDAKTENLFMDNLSVTRPAGQSLVMYLSPKDGVVSIQSGVGCGE